MNNRINLFLNKFEIFNDLLLIEINKIKILEVNNLIRNYYNYFKILIQINQEFNENIISIKTHKKLILSEINKINITSKKIEKIILKKDILFLEKIELVKLLLLENKRNIIILKNMLASFKHFKFDPDYLKYENISYTQLRFGDIVLSLKNDKIINSSWIYKMIFINTKSHIGHARMFYELKNNNPYFIDVPKMSLNVKFKKTVKKYNNDVIGVVMRRKLGLTNQEEDLMKLYIRKNVIGKKFAFFKGAFLSIIFKSYEKFSFYENLNNPFSKIQSVFCSENIIRIYESANIFIGDKDDEATITPVDLFNCKKLEIIGYINK